MKTFKDLKDEIERIAKIDVKGFDSEQVLRKFARDQALTNIALIKPYTDKYADSADDIASEAYATSAAAADATSAASATPADAASATYATTAADADYTKAIASLKSLANEYLALLACAE